MRHISNYLWLYIFIFSSGFAVSAQAQEFRQRAHHIFLEKSGSRYRA